MGRVEGKVAIVTGAAKGLGEADARLLAREGATVILTDVDEVNGRRVTADIGGPSRFVRQDVRDEDGWRALIEEVMAREGRLDVLVNNAGVVEAGHVENTTMDNWRFVMAVSADGTFLGCKHAIPAMRTSGGGSIINMASVASLGGHHTVFSYVAAKGAVEALTRAVAVHCTQTKTPVRCNSIHPAGMDTPMVRGMGKKMADAGMAPPRPADAPPPLTALGSAEDIAYAVLYLASDESRFVNGQKLVVDNTLTVTPAVVPA
ncbi:MAG: short-chain dehydrogenase [Caulobacteraceae bacterium]|nr:short-chain dehydrogenase [Caulobacteraceae bacterium]